jgi:hypothetical protein
MEAERLKMEPRRVCRPVVADSLQLDEERDPDLIRIRKHIKVKVGSGSAFK